MSKEGYHHFCPVAKACEILEPRWTMLVLCELLNGYTRFNDIRRGIPSMSPTLLSKRLKDMERKGLVRREKSGASGEVHYRTSKLADELAPIIVALGDWAHRNVDADVCLEKIDARVLMWNMRRKVNTAVLPARRKSIIHFIFPELPEPERNYWIVGRPGMEADLCVIDPGQDVDLYITADLKALASAWMGHTTLATEISRGKVNLVGDELLINSIGNWMVRSRFAAA
jgi:DNA-binding HxlR family transcriptional regulator